MRWLLTPWHDTLVAMERLADAPRPMLALGLTLVSLLAAWYVYVPIHELLHALGCLATGGEVSVLEIQPQYGGTLLAQVFPFVVAGGEYAGRLSGFETHGSDWVYLATDALPFTLSVAVGVPLLRACGRAPRPLWLGPGVVLGLAPFYNLPGDYYEMGSILATATAGALLGPPGAFDGLRSDDVFLLLGRWSEDASALGLTSAEAGVAPFVFAAAVALAVILAFATYAAGDAIARLAVGAPAAPARRPARPGPAT